MTERKPSVVVFSPSPLLTITIENGVAGPPEIHLHAGGQGFWVARMVAGIGVPVALCGPFGDDTGRVPAMPSAVSFPAFTCWIDGGMPEK